MERLRLPSAVLEDHLDHIRGALCRDLDDLAGSDVVRRRLRKNIGRH